MGNIISKIVLTGGPCAGKTTALARLLKSLELKGYKVLVVSESASELINGEIKPFGNNPLNMVDFQKLIIPYQLNKEKTYEGAVNYLNDDTKCVIIYDRGIMDNKAYIKDDEFTQILKQLNLSEVELMDNYDMVLHLVTAAIGKEEFYTLENNQARKETIEEATILDQQTLQAWVGHRNLKVIDNSTDFMGKLDRVLEEVFNLINEKWTVKNQRKYLIDSKSNIDKILNSKQIKIEQTYLDSNSLYERRLRKRTIDNESTYFYTVQRKKGSLREIVRDKKIKEKDYLKMLAEYNHGQTLTKTRYLFMEDGIYYSLDIFDEQDLIILEADTSNDYITLPKGIIMLEEVTNNDDYSNVNLKNNSKQKIKG